VKVFLDMPSHGGRQFALFTNWEDFTIMQNFLETKYASFPQAWDISEQVPGVCISNSHIKNFPYDLELLGFCDVVYIPKKFSFFFEIRDHVNYNYLTKISYGGV
jgi:hypothetical protein